MHKQKYILLSQYYKRIVSYGAAADLESRVDVYNICEYVHRPCLYHHLNKNYYNLIRDAFRIDESILDDLVERGINNIIYTDDEGGDHFSMSTVDFINYGEVLRGKVYLPIEYCDSYEDQYVSYIPRLSKNKK